MLLMVMGIWCDRHMMIGNGNILIKEVVLLIKQNIHGDEGHDCYCQWRWSIKCYPWKLLLRDKKILSTRWSPTTYQQLILLTKPYTLRFVSEWKGKITLQVPFDFSRYIPVTTHTDKAGASNLVRHPVVFWFSKDYGPKILAQVVTNFSSNEVVQFLQMTLLRTTTVYKGMVQPFHTTR